MWLPLYLISKIFQCWYAILPSQIYFLWWRHQCFRWHSSVKTLFLENIFVKYSLVGCIQVCTTGIVSKIGDVCHQHLKLSPTLKYWSDFWTNKSAFTVTALSIDRFCAVASPLKMRRYRSRSTAFYVTLTTWILSFLWIRDAKLWYFGSD